MLGKLDSYMQKRKITPFSHQKKSNSKRIKHYKIQNYKTSKENQRHLCPLKMILAIFFEFVSLGEEKKNEQTGLHKTKNLVE